MTSPPPGPPGTTPPGSSAPPPGSGPGETPPLGPAANDPSVRNRNIILGVTLLVVGVAVGVLIAFIVRDDANDSAKKKVTTTTSSSTSTTTEPTTTTTSTTTEPTTTTTAAPKAPVINSFSIPSTVDCPTNQPVPITLSWSTSHAESVALSIDGPGIYGTYPANGSTQVNFPCDGASHLYRLAARANGQPDAVQSKTVNPTSGP